MRMVIEVENLSKKFRLQTRQTLGSGTLRDALAGVFKNKFRERAEKADDFWALRDVSFAVEQGATLGIIGANGAGKSTLLKILSRITRPTSGQAVLRGRVGSLLEVGTGFHPELSGRENIFLNGAVLGMMRREIERKFDEIVAFSDLEQFLEMPVKHYSSGMYMRLAFAVAAHMEPEILIVDEVLAVGDAAFQKKCLGKMNEVAAEGRTILFVSHNAAALHRLCKTAVYLERGRVKNYGAINAVLAEYYADVEKNNAFAAADRQDADSVPEGAARFVNWRLVDASTHQPHTIYSRETATFEFTLVSKHSSPGVNFMMFVRDVQDQNLVIAHNLLGGVGSTELKRGVYKIRWRVPLPLKAGNYKVLTEIHSDRGEGTFDVWEAAPQLNVLPVLEYQMPVEAQGVINLPISFELQSEV
jgi:ABC-type polysaccharide/polyol phosphate transport system ATPase subunit